MKHVFVAAAVCGAALMSPAQGQELATEKDKVSYAVGAQMGKFLSAGKELIDMEVFMRGLNESLDGKELAMSEEECMRASQTFQQAAQKRAMEEMQTKSVEMKGKGAAWLEENKKKEGVVVLPSGLQYKVIAKGDGASPTPADSVKAHYAGTLIDGTEFDSSYKRGGPAEFPVTRVIKGWTEALQLMKIGDKWELYIPYDLAYGEQGRPPQIPGYAPLVFTIELVEIIPPKTAAPKAQD